MALNSKKIARGYARVSTDLQLDGISLEVQEMRIASYCAQHGYTLVKMYKDALSGKDTDRPQLQFMLKELRQGEVVLVVDLSRLSRKTIDALQLIERFNEMKVGFISITQPFDTTTPVGEAMLTVQLGFNQMERKNTALKVKGAMQTLKQQGKLRGKPPFGWKFVGKERDFQPVPEQQQVIEKIRQLHLAGISMTKIASILNQDGDCMYLAYNKKSPEKYKNTVFYQMTVKRILIENGIISDGEAGHIKPIEQQIISHHKTSRQETNNTEVPPNNIVPNHNTVLPPPPNYNTLTSLPISNRLPPPPNYNTLTSLPISNRLPPPPNYNTLTSLPISNRLPPPPTTYNPVTYNYNSVPNYNTTYNNSLTSLPPPPSYNSNYDYYS